MVLCYLSLFIDCITYTDYHIQLLFLFFIFDILLIIITQYRTLSVFVRSPNTLLVLVIFISLLLIFNHQQYVIRTDIHMSFPSSLTFSLSLFLSFSLSVFFTVNCVPSGFTTFSFSPSPSPSRYIYIISM